MGTRFYPAGDLILALYAGIVACLVRALCTLRLGAVFNLQSRTGKSLDAVKTIRILQINKQEVKPFLAQFVEAKKCDLVLISEQY